MKNNKLLIYLMFVCVFLSIVTLGIVAYDKFIKKKDEPSCNCPRCEIKDSKTERKITVKKDDKDYVLDFDDIESRLLNSQDKATLTICNCKDIDLDNIDDMKCNNKDLSKESIKKVINKLYNAKKVVWAPTGKMCAEYKYAAGDDFFLFEADDTSILLVSIDQDGYAFYYENEDVRDFLKNLS